MSDAAIGLWGIPVMVACKWRLSALPVLTFINVRSAPFSNSAILGTP
jgi:hypothetical protein